jgi:hypothetical protein
MVEQVQSSTVLKSLSIHDPVQSVSDPDSDSIRLVDPESMRPDPKHYCADQIYTYEVSIKLRLLYNNKR